MHRFYLLCLSCLCILEKMLGAISTIFRGTLKLFIIFFRLLLNSSLCLYSLILRLLLTLARLPIRIFVSIKNCFLWIYFKFLNACSSLMSGITLLYSKLKLRYLTTIKPIYSKLKEWNENRFHSKNLDLHELSNRYLKARAAAKSLPPQILKPALMGKIPYLSYSLEAAWPTRTTLEDWYGMAAISGNPELFVSFFTEVTRIFNAYVTPRELTKEQKQSILQAIMIIPSVPPEFACDLLLADPTIGLKKNEVYELFKLAYGLKKFHEVMGDA